MKDHSSEKCTFVPHVIDLFQFSVLNPQIALLSFLKLGQELVAQPKKIEEAQQDLLNRLIDLQKKFVKIICNKDSNDDAVIDLKYDEKAGKFDVNAIEKSPMIIFAKLFYETTSNWMMDTINNVKDVDLNIVNNAKFFTKQYIEMMSPDNIPFLNAEVMKETINTHGENIRKGMEMLLHDIKIGTITTNDRNFFKLGENIATTKGKVVYKNQLLELIQYLPTTENVFAKPMLFVPPWINKFYVLDLNAEQSLVKWAVDKGITIFMISWVNPNKKHENIGFENYAIDGLLAVIDKIADLTNSTSVHTLGYCVGGTLISTLLSYLAHPLCLKRSKAKIESATLLTTLLDFEHTGDMAIFMADNYLEAINVQLKDKGFLDGKIMYNTFSSLKSKDMIWRYFVTSYMLGEKPKPHEILFWNSDPTNLTKKMQLFLSNDLYRDNLLKMGKLKIMGIPLNLKLVNIPLYMLSTKKDHLVPWRATFDSMKLFNNDKMIRFVLGGSGHVAGIINPPSKNKYCYWTNANISGTAEQWIESATQLAGSWWSDWFEWLKPMMGSFTEAAPIENSYCDAPGEYVLNTIDE